MTCPKCFASLYPDRGSVAELARYGYLGGRWHCVMGCTSIWIKERAAAVEAPIKLERRGHYHRRVREITCDRCHQPAQTKGPNTKRCDECRAELRRLRGRERWHRRVRRAA